MEWKRPGVALGATNKKRCRQQAVARNKFGLPISSIYLQKPMVNEGCRSLLTVHRHAGRDRDEHPGGT